MQQLASPSNLPNPNGLPEIIRVKVIRGFRGEIDGKFGTCAPGDVVDVPRALAIEQRHAGRCVAATGDEEPKRQLGYLPERKKNPPASPADQLAALTAAVANLTKLVAGLVPAPEGGGKK